MIINAELWTLNILGAFFSGVDVYFERGFG